MLRLNLLVLMLVFCCSTFLLADSNTKLNIEDILNDDSPIVRLRYPSLSPDGKLLAFSTQGDIWISKPDGSDPRRVSAHPDREIKPIWMPNSKELLYVADYSGDFDIYRISIEGGTPTRLTHYQTSDYPNDITADGKYVIFYGTREGRSDIFITSTEKMTSPVRLMHTYSDSESMPTITGDMKHVAFEVNGTQTGYPRPAYTGYGDAEIWMADFDNGELSNYRQLTDNLYGDNSPKFVWHPKKQRYVLLYSSYPSENQKIHGNNGIFMIDPLGNEEDSMKPKLLIPSPITRFPLRAINVTVIEDFWHVTIENGLGGVNYYIINPETETIASEKLLNINIHPMQRDFLPQLVIKSNSISEFAYSPNNRIIAAVHNSDIFVGNGYMMEQMTSTPEHEFHPCWGNDNKTLYFVTLMNGNADIYSVNIQNGELKPVINTKHQEVMPTLTPDGKYMLYVRNDRDLRKRNLATGEEVSIFDKGVFERQGVSDEPKYRISASGKFVLFSPKMENDLNANVWVASLDGKIPARQITYFKSNAYNPCWAPDDLNIIFTAYIDHDWDLYALNFEDKPAPGFSEDGLDNLLGRPVKSKTIEEEKEKQKLQTQPQTQPKKPAVKPAPVNRNTTELSDEEVEKWTKKFDEAWDNMKQISSASTHEMNPIIVKNGVAKNVIYTIDNDFWTCNMTGTGHKKLVPVSGRKGYAKLSFDGKNICYVGSGMAVRFDHKTKRNQTTSMRFEYMVDPVKQRLGVYDEAVWVFENYYYSTEKIREWMPAAKFYRRMIAGNSHDNEINAIYYELMGALNSSHTGYYGKSSSKSIDRNGEFGFFFNPRVLFEKGKFLIDEIIDDTVALEIGIKPGMYLLAIDGVELTPDVCIDELLSWKSGKRVFLTLSEKENPAENERMTVKVRATTRTSMWYKQRDNILKARKENTGKWSNGDFGYIHIAGMNAEGVNKLKQELNSFTNKQGFVLDMRGNTGGYTARDILDILYKKPYIMRSYRTFGRVSEDMYRGYSWEKPVVLITDENSVSNAEIFSEGFYKLNIGPIVGMPTTGGVIGTSSYRLSDGTSIRLPGYGCFTTEDVDLEGNPRMPDVLVDKLYYAAEDKDVQLERAIRELRKHALYFAIHNQRPYEVAEREKIEPELEKLYANWLKENEETK